ncbi:hypothetical protein SLEP1_g23250 [Rubroshorea leprosula]|uniref:Protease Do-like PDZ domain-containing protein n=1 Tax=Rubroshorea leprosula TaxID=152421 RepID=A0AAV5JL37_9ROSI|nr:hypothetical protein SLEP1_g23250 [Rubroshorea leprosula]
MTVCSLSACKDEYLVFEFEEKCIAVLDRIAASAASSCILKDYGIPFERSPDLLEPYVDLEDNQAMEQDLGDTPVSNSEIGFDGIIWV